MKHKKTAIFLFLIFTLVMCGTVSADQTTVNESVNVSVNSSGSAGNGSVVNSGQDCLPTVAHGTINGEVYISSTAGWPGSNPDIFNVPNGTVVFARYYAGVWMGTATSTFNGHDVPITGSYSSGMGVTWISYDVTSYVIPGGLNTASSSSSGGDGRQYGNTLVVVLQNDTKPLIEYWITEGLDWLNYNPPSVDWSNTTIAGTVNQANVQNASLYSVHLTGYNYEDLNGYTLPNPSEHVSGGYFDALRWDNIQGLLVAENQSINVGRGDDSYTSPVFHALIIEYQTYDLVPVNLTPTIVTPNTSNTMTTTIENRGSTDSPAFDVSLLVDGTVVDTKSVTSLASGDSTSVNFNWIHDGTKYNYNLKVSVDPTDVVHEIDETNNILDVLIGTTTAPTPVAGFTATPTTDDAPLTVNFTDQSSNSPITWAWDFNNDGIVDSTEQNPTYTYGTAGTYTIKLTVTNAGGSDDEVKSNYIHVNAPVTPVANFTATPISGEVPLTVQFTDTSTNNPRSWAWDFNNDGIVDSTEQNPTYTYETAGTYAVKLTAGNAAGSDDETKTDYVNVSAITPVANFTASTAAGLYPLTIQFTDTSLNDPTSWAWDFNNDGIVDSTEQNPTHTYTNVGNYTVKLTVANLNGSDEEVQNNCVRVTNSTAPVADFTATPTIGDSPLTVQFNDQSTSSGSSERIKTKSGSLRLEYDPSFYGNDSTSFSQIVDLTGVNSLTFYYQSGCYTESGEGSILNQLSIGNNIIWQSSDLTDGKLVTVNIPSYTGLQTIKFTLNVIGLMGPGEASFYINNISAIGTNSTTSWLWDFDDGNTSAEQNPTHTYASAGAYTVNLTVASAVGNDSEEKTNYILVDPSDLTVTGNVDVVPLNKNTVFAKETNPVKVTVVNNGSGTATNIVVALYASDVSGMVPVATATIDSLAAGASTTIEIIDPTIRNLEGGTVTYTVKVDPDNLIPETNETNNAMDSTVKTVKYNGYKGKQYWEGGSNVTTQRTYDIYGNIVYSNGDSSYHSGGWNDYTVTWSDIQPTIPTTASITEAWLYVAYTWDETGLVPNNLTLTFNGHVLNYVNWYVDQANFGTYANYKYGLLTYNVTEFYNKNGVNTLFLDRNGNSSIAMYPSNLMVIYEDANSTRKQIFINEEADLLGFSPTSYGTTLDEATAYVPFTGLVIDTSKVKNATFYSSAGNAGPDEGNLLWNGSLIKSNAWNGTSTGIFTLVKDVTSYLTSTGNVAGIQGTNSGGMAALQQILVVEYAPDLVVTNITVNKGSGDNWFANEPNNLTITLTNQGGSNSPESTLNIDVNGTTYTVNISALDAGSSTTVTVTDPTSRTSGDNVPVSAAADPSNSIPETNETNNSYSLTFTVYNNGYKGKRYTNGTDLETNQTFEGNYDVIYSGGNSTYRSGGTGGSAWNNPYTVTWTGSDLPIPSSATVVQVRLYQPYTWNTVLGVPDFVANFNGNVLTYLVHYNDTKGYGTSNYPSGLFVYDVTSYFNSAGNTLSLTKGINTTISLYGGYLVVIYQDANATYKKIYINDGADLLCSSNSFSVNDTEATAYANYKSISTANMSNASMVVVLASADKANQSKFFFNGHEYTGFNTAYNSTSQTGFSVYDVFSNMQNGSNLAGIQSYNNGTTGDNMVALSSILIITYDTASPTVNATPIGGLFNTTQTVTLTATDDQDTNPTIYYTTNGTTPTTSSSVYTGPITVNSTTTLKFFAVDETGNTATVQTQVYTIDTTAPAVSASPDGGIFNTTKTVTLHATDNLDTNPVIYFTTDGTTPTISSTQYTAPITVSNTTTLKFFAVDDVGNPSAVQSKTYTIDTVAPEVNADLDNGTFDVVKSVNLSTTDNLDTNPTIYYTTDGSTPTTSSSVYTGPITVDKAMNLKFFAVDDAGNPSPVGSRTYDVKSDVYVEVTASNVDPSVGDTVRYTFKLCNRGPGTATNVVFTYQIPEGMEYAGVSKDSGSVSYDPATRTITWTFSELVAGDPYLWLDLRVLSAGTYLIQPLVTTSNYNPRLTSNIGSLKVNAVVKPASTVLAASKITSSVQADTVPMQTTGLPLGALFAGLLCIVSGLGLHRRF